jgi:hypothetical protein
MVSAEVEQALSLALYEAAFGVTGGELRPGSVAWSPSVHFFLMELARESLIFREEEWRALGLAPDNPEAVRHTLLPVFAEVLHRAEEIASERDNQAPLIAVVELLTRQWCGVFPLCR